MEQIVRLYHNSKVKLKVKLIFKIQNKYANGRATVEVTDIHIYIIQFQAILLYRVQFECALFKM